MFDLAAGDRVDEGMRNLETEMDEFAKLLETQQQNIAAKVARNLGQEVTPKKQDFAHRMAMAASASSGAAPASEVQTMDEDRSEAVKRRPAAGGNAPKEKSKTKGEAEAKAKANAGALEPPMEVSAPDAIAEKKWADAPESKRPVQAEEAGDETRPCTPGPSGELQRRPWRAAGLFVCRTRSIHWRHWWKRRSALQVPPARHRENRGEEQVLVDQAEHYDHQVPGRA